MMYLQASVGSADITMLFSSVTINLIVLVRILSIIFSRYRILFLKFISIFKIRKKSHEFYVKIRTIRIFTVYVSN